MSRTKRQIPQAYFIHQGMRIEFSDISWKDGTIKGSKELFQAVYPSWGIGHKCFEDFSKKQPDGKPYHKPNKNFKKPRRQQERARAKQAIREDKDPEKVRKSDVWDWN